MENSIELQANDPALSGLLDALRAHMSSRFMAAMAVGVLRRRNSPSLLRGCYLHKLILSQLQRLQPRR